MEVVKEIPITEIEGLRIGNAQDEEACTGVTVLMFDRWACAGVDISGGGPASRETPLASPLTADNPLNALVLSGGSAFGLAASEGVMQYLEERGIGFDTGFGKVPLVCQSCIYDLGYGSSKVRPDAAMGYAACVDAEKNAPSCGSVGGGTGATVGKLYGMKRSMKAGLGIHAVSVGRLKMGAVVIVNALGDLFDPRTGEQIAGLRTRDGQGMANTCQEMYQISEQREQLADGLTNTNTTIGAIVTNARFSKAEMKKIASMARAAYARCINPVGTLADGDTIYAVSLGDVSANINIAGTLAAEVMAEAIQKAVRLAGTVTRA